MPPVLPAAIQAALPSGGATEPSNEMDIVSTSGDSNAETKVVLGSVTGWWTYRRVGIPLNVHDPRTR